MPLVHDQDIADLLAETRTIAISIYDRVQSFDLAGANQMALLLLVFSLGAVGASFFASARLAIRR